MQLDVGLCKGRNKADKKLLNLGDENSWRTLSFDFTLAQPIFRVTDI